MAAKRGGGESKTGLVVFLVLFILLSIGLGVTTYYGYQEADAQKKVAADKEKEAKQWTNDANYWKFLALTYRSYIGLPPTKDPVKDGLPTLRAEFDKGAGASFAAGRDDNKDDHTSDVKKIWADDTTMKWDVANGKPAETYTDQINKLKAELVKKDEAVKAAEKKAKDLDEELKASGRQLEKAKTDYENQLKAQDAKNTDSLQDKLATIANQQKELDEWKKKPLKDLDDQRKEIIATNKENGELKARLKSTTDTLKKVQGELAQVRSAGDDVDVTKVAPENLAKVTSINGAGDILYINLGSADNLKRQVTFSIYGKGLDGRPLKEPKGKLEVIRVTGERQAQARITELRDERRDPVLPGDFLYNPAWNPNLKQHVVLIGTIDLTGEGRDNVQEFIRNLKNQNVDVDAYMDMKTRKLRKPNSDAPGEITRGTDLLIVGTGPEYGAGAIRGGADKDPKGEILKAMQDFEKDAERLGVRIVRLNSFLEMSGYPLPKSLGSDKGKIDFHKSLESSGSPVKRADAPK